MTTDQAVNPSMLRLFYDPPGTLRLTIDDERSYHTVKLYQAWPLSQPSRHIVLQDGKGEEIAMVETLDDLTMETRVVAEEELRRRYLTARVEAIRHIRTEFGVTYWHVVTDKGERDFVIQSLSESAIWLGDDHILLIDVDGNRFEIADREALDPESRLRLDAVL